MKLAIPLLLENKIDLLAFFRNMNSMDSRKVIYIYTFVSQKTLLHKLLLLVFKIVESLQCILNMKIIQFPPYIWKVCCYIDVLKLLKYTWNWCTWSSKSIFIFLILISFAYASTRQFEHILYCVISSTLREKVSPGKKMVKF